MRNCCCCIKTVSQSSKLLIRSNWKEEKRWCYCYEDTPLYSNHLNTGLVWYSKGRFVSGCQMVWYPNGGPKIKLKKACLWSKIFGIWMVRQVTWLYHLNTRCPYYPVFRCSVFRWILYYIFFWFRFRPWQNRCCQRKLFSTKNQKFLTQEILSRWNKSKLHWR